ncbi:MAG: hypothetical protein ACRDV2_14575, partial [Actinomycetes bacterium]
DTGESMPATLHPTGWDGTRMFAVTVDPAKDSAPQRMVASGRDGNVLEAVDLPSRFGDGWLTSRSACAGGGGATWIDPEVQREVSVELGTSDAVISVGERQECLSQLRRTALAGWHAAGSLVVAVVAPETATVRLADGDQVVDELKPFTVPGSLWQVATFRAADPSQLPRVELVALDRHGQELDREFVSQPSTP